ncbi:MAG: C40 family peptidase [Rhodobacteraceae bacterium]|nr:C40 family peptidase [Paracoccaceae bacterium]
MRDRRSNPDPALVDGQSPAQVCLPVVDLLARPHGPRDRQLIFGETVRVFSTGEGFAYVIADKDGYIGFVPIDALRKSEVATHRVSALATHVYAEANIKTPDRLTLSFGSRMAALSETPKFIETRDGFIPKCHLAAADTVEASPITVARMYLGTPYLWGGNSRLGLDCSGLVQAAFLACGMACPGDSDQQEDAFAPHRVDGAVRQTGDLLFWKGHVGLMADETTLIHANGHHMSVVLEDAQQAIDRIARQGDGPVTAHIRVPY